MFLWEHKGGTNEFEFGGFAAAVFFVHVSDHALDIFDEQILACEL